MKLTAIAGACLVLLGLMLGGCGGGDDATSTDSAEAQASKSQYVARAEAICRKVTDDYIASYKQFAKANGIENFPSAKQGYQISEDLYIPMMEKRLAALRSLDAPSGDEQQVEAINAALAKGISEANKEIKLVTEGSRDIFEKYKTRSKAYGLKYCGL